MPISETKRVSYADWMRSVTTMAVEMEVNAQLGEFTVRKNRLKSLQRSVREMPDFTAALGATLAAHGAAEKRSKRANRRARRRTRRRARRQGGRRRGGGGRRRARRQRRRR